MYGADIRRELHTHPKPGIPFTEKYEKSSITAAFDADEACIGPGPDSFVRYLSDRKEIS